MEKGDGRGAIFMFILGMSVSLALEKRRARKGPSLRLFPHVPIRSVPLIVIGLMDVNRGTGLGRACRDMFDWPHGL
ncbi:MAG: hypothetical protein ACUVV5_03260 [Candidatus Aminicenantales bacterium]